MLKPLQTAEPKFAKLIRRDSNPINNQAEKAHSVYEDEWPTSKKESTETTEAILPSDTGYINRREFAEENPDTGSQAILERRQGPTKILGIKLVSRDRKNHKVKFCGWNIDGWIV